MSLPPPPLRLELLPTQGPEDAQVLIGRRGAASSSGGEGGNHRSRRDAREVTGSPDGCARGPVDGDEDRSDLIDRDGIRKGNLPACPDSRSVEHFARRCLAESRSIST